VGEAELVEAEHHAPGNGAAHPSTLDDEGHAGPCGPGSDGVEDRIGHVATLPGRISVSMGSFVHTERVRFGDLDAMRHLNNVVYLRYFESARIAYIRSLFPEHDPAHPESGTFGVIFAECHINYRAPVHFDEEVAVHCSVSDVRRSSFRVDFAMRVGERLVAAGYGVLVGYDYAAGAAAPLPDDFRATVEAAATAEPASS
jgi:acyl-CoA thioester hydrolase